MFDRYSGWNILFAALLIVLTGLIIGTSTMTDDVHTDTTDPPYGETGYMHISFDDVTSCFDNLSTGTYAYLFDEPFFGELESLHDKCGAKFSLYTYNSTLDDVPDSYPDDFSDNCDWLKIGFHSNTPGESLANTDYESGKAYWNDFVSNVMRMCGTIDSLDRIPRMEYFSGTEQAISGMRDAEYGAIGFLSADDDRPSYHFDDDMMTHVYDNDRLEDEATDLLFISTDIRFDWWYDFTSDRNYKRPVKTNVYDELAYRKDASEYSKSFDEIVVFTHEWLVYDGHTIDSEFETAVDSCRFAMDHGIAFDYAQNRTGS